MVDESLYIKSGKTELSSKFSGRHTIVFDLDQIEKLIAAVAIAEKNRKSDIDSSSTDGDENA